MKIARSSTQLKTAQPVCIPNVSIHAFLNEPQLSQLAAGVAPHANMSKKRKTTVQSVTRIISIQFA